MVHPPVWSMSRDCGIYLCRPHGTHLIGEVKNNGADTIRFAKITATYYDAQNHTIGTDFTFTDPMDILAGSSTPFDHNHLMLSTKQR